MNALTRAVRPAAAQMKQSRSIIDGLVSKPNNLAEVRAPYLDPKKAHLHGADNPTYLKAGGDGVVSGVAILLCTLSFGQFLRGVGNMSYGVGKLE